MQEKKNLPTDPYGDLDVEMLKRFSEANGICGHEKGASRVMAEYLKDAADTIDYDNLGSIIGCKKGKGEGPSVALFGHLDEVGFLVKKIEDNGFIRVINVGGMWPHLLLAQEVTITTRDGREYVGVISSPPPHGMPAEERAKVKEQATTIAVQEKSIERMKPKEDYCDKVLSSPNAVPITIIAKDYGFSAQAMNELLYVLGVQYKRGQTWVLKQEYARAGYTKSYTYLAPSGESVVQTRWTQKGRLFIYELLKKERGILPLDGKAA